ncbi:plasmid recombination protein [Bacillus paranthracis]|nr:plasmid recombination protein [Bacillus paranthracis]MCR6795808.1 plasmid recombination protein [Bacillus paranthracis]
MDEKTPHMHVGMVSGNRRK